MPSRENITSLTSFPRARITFYYLHTLILYHVTKDGMRINQSKHRTTSQILTRIWLKPKKGGGGGGGWKKKKKKGEKGKGGRGKG